MRAMDDTVSSAGHRECADRTYQNEGNLSLLELVSAKSPVALSIADAAPATTLASFRLADGRLTA